MKPFITFSLLLLCLISCKEDDSTKLEIPFNEFTMTHGFGEMPPTDYPYYLYSSALEDYDRDDYYKYSYLVDNLPNSNPPFDCSRKYEINETSAFFEISCTLKRSGSISPNDKEWPENLDYTVRMEADLESMVVTSAVVTFPYFNQSFDFTEDSYLVFLPAQTGNFPSPAAFVFSETNAEPNGLNLNISFRVIL
jgi:hypothetical protein